MDRTDRRERDDPDWQERAVGNAKKLAALIDQEAAHPGRVGGRQVRDFWDHAKKVGAAFKELKPLRREDREQLWERHNELCTEAKRRQQQARADQAAESRRKRDLVMDKLSEAANFADGARDVHDIDRAYALIDEAREWMKDGWSGFNAATDITSMTSGRMSRDDRSTCHERIRAVQARLRSRRDELRRAQYDRLERAANAALNTAVDGDIREAKDAIKRTQRDLKTAYMTREQRDLVRDILNDAWQRTSARSKEKQREWRERQEGHIERWTQRLHDNEDFIHRMESQIDECRSLLYDARSPEFAAKVEGWIDEKQERLRDARNQNTDLRAKIADVEARLRE